MNLNEIRQLEQFLTPAERDELAKLLEQDFAAVRWRALAGPQLMAYDSTADITGYGGAAGGGKTDLLAGLVTTRHKRCLVVRREKAQTRGVIQRLTEILGNTNGFNGQLSEWKIGDGVLCEFAGLDNPGDERRWQGRPHDLKAFDEVTEMREDQVRFVMGWNRTNDPKVPARALMTFNPPTTPEGRWVIDFFGPWLDQKHALYPTQPGAIRYAAMLPGKDGVAKDRWLDRGDPFVLVDGEPCYEFDAKAFSPEQIIVPRSRTFIPARLTDNPIYMATGYMSTLQALPEPLRSQMLYGDFQAGIVDDAWQLIPTAWVDAAQARWRPIEPKGEMLSMGIDVARGGKDNTTIGKRHATPDGGRYWFDHIDLHKGTETPNGPLVAGLAIGARRDDAPMHIDVIGVGASPYDVLNTMGLPVYGINVAEKAQGTDKSGKLRFINRRSELYWRVRELLDPATNSGIALPPDAELKKELCAITWKMSGFTIQVASRDEIYEKVKRSIDRATAIMLAAIDTPKVHLLKNARAQEDALNYDPMAHTRGPAAGIPDYDPMGRR